METNIPIVLFIFKRSKTLSDIIGKIRKAKPKKMYLIADGPRNESEKELTDQCRKLAEELIDWDCEIVKRYSNSNIGVIYNIGEGARWVFNYEDKAIFLEDDNLPEDTFFEYCYEMLDKYQKNEKVLWVCGTNYLGEYDSNFSYIFTQHLLPCGWASWKDKFLNYYDVYLESLNNKEKLLNFKDSYKNKSLCKQQLYSVERTRYLIENYRNKSSWDYQMLFTIRSNNMYGISPTINQIKNIGVDEYSTHGGFSWKNEMTRRFCGMKSNPLTFPLNHPQTIEIDEVYEKKIDEILLMPIKDRLFRGIASMIKPLFGLKPYDSFAEFIKKVKKRYDSTFKKN